jgi:hypothetical protein
LSVRAGRKAEGLRAAIAARRWWIRANVIRACDLRGVLFAGRVF